MEDHIEFTAKNLEKSIKYKENSSYKEIIKFIKRAQKKQNRNFKFY